MLIFGLGLTKSHWKKIFRSIQAPLKPHLISARLLSSREIEPQAIISTCQHLQQSPPVLALITPRGFETFTDCLFFLSQMRLHLASQKTYYGLIVEKLSEDFAPFLPYSPKLTTHAQKSLVLKEQSLLAEKAQDFSYFSESEAKRTRIKYTNSHGSVVTQSLEQLPQDELIALTQVQQVLLGQKSLAVSEWLEYALQKRGQESLKLSVRGILKNSQGVSFSAGLTLEDLQSLQLGDLRLDFILSYHALSPENQTFQKMIETLNSQIHTPKQEVSTSTKKPVRCLGTLPIINQIAMQILAQQGFEDVQVIDDFADGTHTLEDTFIWVQLNPFPRVKLIGQKHDLSDDVQKMIQQVSAFIPIEQLQFHHHSAKKRDFEKNLQRLHRNEQKKLESVKRIERDLLILNQEVELLEICRETASFLQQQLTDARQLENQENEDLETVILFASDYQQVGKKTIWIDPFEYVECEDLRRFPLARVQKSMAGGMMIAQGTARQHLGQLCQKTQEQFQLCSQSLQTQQTGLELLKKQIKQLKEEKNATAVQWIDSSLQNLLQFETDI